MYIVRPILLQILYFVYLFYCSKFSECFIVDILYIFFLFDSRYQTDRKVHIFCLVDCRHVLHVLHGCLQICWKEGKGLTDIEWHGLPSKVSIRSNFSHMLHQINLINYRGSQTRALHKFIHHHNSLLKRTWWKFIHHHRPEERYSILWLGEAFNWPKSVKILTLRMIVILKGTEIKRFEKVQRDSLQR